jgi:hypothetical protein
LALWSLSANPAFPQPTGNDADGNVLWNTTDITAFVAQHRAAIANGWKIGTASLPSFNFAYAASNPPVLLAGPADPLFEDNIPAPDTISARDLVPLLR